MAGKHRAPDQPGDTKTKRGEPRRAPKPGEKPRRKPGYKRHPIQIIMPDHPEHPAARDRTQELPVVSPRPIDRPADRPAGRRSTTTYDSRRSRRDRRAAALAGEASAYAQRAALRASSGAKPSTTGRAVSGAAAGAATGAAIGSAIPGLGTAVGAGGGAILGGAGGAISGHRAKRAYKAARRASTAGSRKLLLAEFAVCAAITGLSPLTDAHQKDGPGDFMKRMSAVFGLFFILAMVASAGRGSAKLAAGLGGLVTVVLMVTERNLFVQLAQVFNALSPPPTTSGPGGVAGQSLGEAVSTTGVGS
jgi:hypothetical protein